FTMARSSPSSRPLVTTTISAGGGPPPRPRHRPHGAATGAAPRRPTTPPPARAPAGRAPHATAPTPPPPHAPPPPTTAARRARHGRTPHGGVVCALRARGGRSLLPGHPRQVPRHLPQRTHPEDRRRRVFLGGLCRARRRQRSQAAQAGAEDDQAGRAHHARF